MPKVVEITPPERQRRGRQASVDWAIIDELASNLSSNKGKWFTNDTVYPDKKTAYRELAKHRKYVGQKMNGGSTKNLKSQVYDRENPDNTGETGKFIFALTFTG